MTYFINSNKIKSGGKSISGITVSQWKQLQAMAAVSKQKQKLIEMTDYFCKNITKVLVTLFDNVLKHKCLHKESKTSFSGIDVKQFNFLVIIDHGLKFNARLLNATEQEKGNNEYNDDFDDDNDDCHINIIIYLCVYIMRRHRM